jgi:primosomal replication protein N
MLKPQAKKVVKTEFALTFFDIAYSLGGRSNVDVIQKSLEQIDAVLLTAKEQEVLQCMINTYKSDSIYPSWVYLQERYGIISNAPIRNMGDFNTALRDLLSLRNTELMRMEVSNATVESLDSADYRAKLLSIADRYKESANVNTIMTYRSVREQYELSKKNQLTGVTSGVESIDKLTAGFQQGTIVTVAGFTSHGKSTLSNNMAYLNALQGKKVGVVSLEIVPLLCNYIYLSRHSATLGKNIAYQGIISASLSEEQERTLWDIVDVDYLEKVGNNICIVGMEDIPSWTEQGVAQLYQNMEEVLGGLDLVIWDHVNQFKYINFGKDITGDHCIHWLTCLTKTYKTKQDTKPVTVLVTQTNREGFKQAARHDGQYQLTALQDFNEVEKSSTYVVFTFANESNRKDNEAKLQLLKHRLGMVMAEPETTGIDFEFSRVNSGFGEVITSVSGERTDGILGSLFTMQGHLGVDNPLETDFENEGILAGIRNSEANYVKQKDGAPPIDRFGNVNKKGDFQV